MFFIFIVFPDPPVGLNWTVLSMSSSGAICDVVVSWNTHPSAVESVKTGWMSLVYETQYREKDSEQWILVSLTQPSAINAFALDSLLMRNKCVSSRVPLKHHKKSFVRRRMSNYTNSS